MSTPLNAPLNTPHWAEPALARVLDRVAVTRTEVGDRFPLYADQETGRWTATRRGSWTGGFWAGLLWLRARHTDDVRDREAARATTKRLADWAGADTATRGLILWYGTALADDPGAVALQERAARACLNAYDHELGLVPWGSAFGGPRCVARVDGAPGMVPLLASVNAKAAESHLRAHLGLGSPGWSRGRAWLLLAVADALRCLDVPDLRGVARELTPSRRVPLAAEERPDGPLDTSAAAITAVALLKLGQREHAVAVLEELVRVHLAANGALRHGCYDLGSGTATQHELVWGSFFLAFGLAVLTGLVDAHSA
ncbi:sugar ABC transporter permease [Streptomyces sp. NPDC019443]|uniref:sugar ABC transporter permease n=1 Tax=Streptomyces sp. NPDC019443 TaxID=3365061 RepID=UPI00379947A0